MSVFCPPLAIGALYAGPTLFQQCRAAINVTMSLSSPSQQLHRPYNKFQSPLLPMHASIGLQKRES